MKKYIIIGVLILVLLAIAAIFILSSTGLPAGTVALHNQGESVTLYDGEARDISNLFTFRIYNYGIGGCPFNEGVSITIGSREFALATDGCYSAKDVNNGQFVEFGRTEWHQIKELFSNYFGETLLG